MGHKVNPVGLRVGINRTWDSRWFASRGEYGRLLHEDMHIRDHILEQQRQADHGKDEGHLALEDGQLHAPRGEDHGEHQEGGE